MSFVYGYKSQKTLAARGAGSQEAHERKTAPMIRCYRESISLANSLHGNHEPYPAALSATDPCADTTGRRGDRRRRIAGWFFRKQSSDYTVGGTIRRTFDGQPSSVFVARHPPPVGGSRRCAFSSLSGFVLASKYVRIAWLPAGGDVSHHFPADGWSNQDYLVRATRFCQSQQTPRRHPFASPADTQSGYVLHDDGTYLKKSTATA